MCITISEISSILVQCSLKKEGAVFASDNFKGTLADFLFMMFTQVLMEELTRNLIHARKIFKCNVSFKMLLQYAS